MKNMKSINLIFAVFLFISCNQTRTSVSDNVYHKDSLIVDGKKYYLDSISESLYNQVKNEISTDNPDTNLLIVNSDSIIIKANNKTIVFKNDSTDGDNMAFYEFKSYIPEPGYIYIEGSHWEWTSDCYVNIKNGSETNFWNNPTMSPNKKMIIAYSYDLVAGFMPNGIQLYRIDSDTIIQIFETEITNWGPDEIKWESDTSIVIKRAKLDEKYKEHYDYLRMNIIK
jgi:hypothetical protein